MYIISKFKDYYDTALGWGIDKSTVYVRKTEEVSLKTKMYTVSAKYDRDSWRTEVSQVLIGFCGKIYPVIKVHKHRLFSDYCGDEDSANFFYTAEDFLKFREQEGLTLSRKPSWKNYFSSRSYLFKYEVDVKEFFDPTNWNFLKDCFQKYHSPLFTFKNDRRADKKTNLILNPILKDLKFAKVKDPYTAFQDIYMFMAGVLGNIEKDTTDIPDKYKIKQKGFYKYSFKNLPKKKK